MPIKPAAVSFGTKAALKKPPPFMTSETSNLNEDRRLDVSVGAVRGLLLFGYEQYNTAMKGGAANCATYWDGYIRGLQHVLEQEQE